MENNTKELFEAIVRHHKLIDLKRFLPNLENKDLLNRLSTTTPSLYRAYKDLSPDDANPVLNKDDGYSLNANYASFMGISIGASICKVTIVDMAFEPILNDNAESFFQNTCKKLKKIVPQEKQDLLKKCSSELNYDFKSHFYLYFDTPSSLSELKTIIDNIIEESLSEDYNFNILGISISSTGMVNSKKQEIVSASNLTYLENQEISTLLYHDCYSKLMENGISVSLIQNANASVISEIVSLYKKDSPYKECKNVASLYLGVGIGVGLCLNGEIYYGTDGYSGEIGHIPALEFEKDLLSEKEIKMSEESCDSQCTCGRTKCYDHMIRKYVFMKQASDFRNLSTDKIISILPKKTNENINPRFRLFGKYIGGMLASLINTLNLDLIILSGRLYKFDKELQDFIESALDDYCIATSRKACKIVFSDNGTISPALGAAIYAYYSHFGITPSWNLEGHQDNLTESNS